MDLSAYRTGGYADLEGAPTYLWTRGTGAPVVVVHGGPGLDHSYLRAYADSLAPDRCAVLYDQIGCGRDQSDPNDIQIEAVVEQLVRVLRAVSRVAGTVDVVAHSWGAFVTLASLEHMSAAERPRRAVFVCPCPLTKGRNDTAGARLLGRVPPARLDQIVALSNEGTEGAGERVMQLALPAYCGREDNLPDIHFWYSIPAFNATMSSAGDYDVTGAVASLPASTSVLHAGRDFIQPEDFKELGAAARMFENVRDAGHFPFADSPEVVARFMSRALSL